jgi:hypothetical protein
MGASSEFGDLSVDGLAKETLEKSNAINNVIDIFTISTPSELRPKRNDRPPTKVLSAHLFNFSD